MKASVKNNADKKLKGVGSGSSYFPTACTKTIRFFKFLMTRKIPIHFFKNSPYKKQKEKEKRNQDILSKSVSFCSDDYI